jgi:aerobic carbon-monoxide dehydrogenase medium subunit
VNKVYVDAKEGLPVKPGPFDYIRPETVVEAVQVLGQAYEAKVLAGGQSLVPVMNFRLAEPPLLVDINALDEIGGIDVIGGRLRIGAITRMRQLERSEVVASHIPVLAHAAGWVGHVQIRNRGTVGGSIAHGDPSAEVPAMCVLLDAEMTLQSEQGSRVVSAQDFFEGLMTTVLEPEELLTEIHVPLPAPAALWGFSEYAQRHGDFALAGAACVIDEASGQARVVAFGPSSTAIRCTSAEAVLATGSLSDVTPAAAAEAALADVEAVTDRSSAEARHRALVVGLMVRNAVTQCVQRKVA